MTPHEEFETYSISKIALCTLQHPEASAQPSEVPPSWDPRGARRLISRMLRVEEQVRASLHGMSMSAPPVIPSSKVSRASALRPVPPKDQPLAAFESRLQKVETSIEQIRAERAPADDDEVDAPPDAHFDWIQMHMEELRAYPNAYVLLDPKRGIVFHSTDGDELTARLEGLDPEEQDRLMVFHTSMAL